MSNMSSLTAPNDTNLNLLLYDIEIQAFAVNKDLEFISIFNIVYLIQSLKNERRRKEKIEN